MHSWKKREARGDIEPRPVSWLAQWYSQFYGKAVAFTEGKPRVFVPHEEFCADPEPYLERIAGMVGISPSPFDVENYHKKEWHPTGGNTQVCVRKAPLELRTPWKDEPPIEVDPMSRRILDRAYEGLNLLGETESAFRSAEEGANP